MEKPKATVEIKPVAWTSGKVNKYQGFATYGKRRIIGDPMPTEDEALDSLIVEVSEWSMAVSEMDKALCK